MKVMYVLKVKVIFRLSFCLCSQWQGLCSTGLAATGGLEAGGEHLLPSAKVIFCHHGDDDDIDDMDGVDGVDRQLVRMGYRFLVRGCKGL